MSAQAISFVWDIPNISAEERLILIWIANSCGQLGQPYCPEWIGMGDFIGADYETAFNVTYSLVDKGLLKWGGADDSSQSYLWIVYDGNYDPPVDWTAEVKSRSGRVCALIERDGAKCAYCDCTPVQYEVDHFVPRAKGGADSMDNLVLACRECNRRKRDTMPETYLKDDPHRFYVLSTNLKWLHE